MEEARVRKIDPSERNQQLIVKSGIGGGASLSMQRRTLDSRFARDISWDTASMWVAAMTLCISSSSCFL